MHRACLVILVLLLTHTAHAGWKTPFGTLFNSKPDTSFKYYVADVRDRPWDVKYRTTNIEDSLLSRLECRGPAIDESLELYDSNYNLIVRDSYCTRFARVKTCSGWEALFAGALNGVSLIAHLTHSQTHTSTTGPMVFGQPSEFASACR